MISDKTRNLFLFIEFLHENIENFNQYDHVILKLNIARDKIYSLGTHFTEVREKKVLQKEIDEMWNLIDENIIYPLKDTIAYLGLFNWYKPETLSNIHLPDVLLLSENCEEEDVAIILKAKTHYIELTNKISCNIINYNSLLFRYLNEVMQVVVDDFKEEGDKQIKDIEEKQYATLQEAVSNFNSGETVSFPLPQNIFATEKLQSAPNLAHANTDTNLSNNVELLNNNTMVINYEYIFELLLSQADDSEQMKAYCISQQKIAKRDFYFGEEIFYKGLLKVVAEKKELAKYQPGPSPTHIGSFFIAGGGGTGYKYESIELLEQIINEILKKSNEKQNTSQPFHIPENVLKELEKEGFILNASETPIRWLKNKQLLRELLMHENIKKKSSKFADVKNATPHYFLDRNNSRIRLANNKPEPSIDSDWIKEKCDQSK